MAYDSVEIMESGRAAVPAGLISETLIAHSEVHEKLFLTSLTQLSEMVSY